MPDSLMDVIVFGAEKRASDVHLGVGIRPLIRVDSLLVETAFDVVTPEMIERYLKEIIPQDRLNEFEQAKELDFAFGRRDIGRFRVNVFYQRGTVGMAIRILPSAIRSFEECGLPSRLMQELASQPAGLVLVTGATGSGKTTTLAAFIDYIAKTRSCHIVTVEDPIEFVFRHDKAKIDQREIGSDTRSFADSLKHVLRQDPDVILVGEMRDLETIQMALTVAETGHLVLATLHTSDAVQTINRVIDVFPAHQQQQVRTQFSFVLNAVISLRLIIHASGQGRILASEILLATPAVRSMIRDSKAHQIYSVMQTSMKEGMKTMNQHLSELVQAKKLLIEDAINESMHPAELCELVGVSGAKKGRDSFAHDR